MAWILQWNMILLDESVRLFPFSFSQLRRATSCLKASEMLLLKKHNYFKGYKANTKNREILVSTFHDVIKRFYLHKTGKKPLGCGIKKKLSESVVVGIGCGRKERKTSHKTSKELQSDPEQSGVVLSAHISIVCHRQRPRRTPRLKEKHSKAALMFIMFMNFEAAVSPE